MLEKIGHILYHVLIVIFPILVYYLLALRNHIHSTWKNKGTLLGIIIIILLLTMSFPVTYANGFSYDFRVIPIFVSFLYIGLFHGITTTLIMLFYIPLLGSPLHLITLINYSVITVILYFLCKKYKGLVLETKLFSISILYWLLTLTRGISIVNNGESNQILTMLIFSIITWITLMVVILLIENLEQQISLQRELKRSEKLNVISQLAASVAHEVRNPMTTINGFLQLISKDENITEQQRSYIHISLEELSRAQAIINDYLSLARPNDKASQLVNISEELTKTIDLMTSYTNIKNVEVTSIIEDSLFIKGSTGEMKQVLINIIKNGIEASKDNGKITIDAYINKETVIIKITDNGEGMSKEQLSRLGTPFYSTKDKGTGIGLTTSFQIIEQFKGKIEVISEVGQGTTFILEFPLYKTESPETS